MGSDINYLIKSFSPAARILTAVRSELHCWNKNWY